MKRLQITAIVLIAGLVLAAQLAIDGLSPSPSWWRYASPSVSAVLVGIWLFERYAWHWPVVRMLGGSRPDLRGTWTGLLQSTWKDPATQEGVPPLETYLVIRQTFSTLSIRLYTAESSSESSTAEIVSSPDTKCQINWVYRNDTRMNVRHRSQIHYGAGSLQIVGGMKPSALEGSYWTDRETRGELRFRAHVSKAADSFEAARTLFPSYFSN